ncbi:hypothetical protein HA466_0023520 [Hirschfeldia incana]|nr:hypothetical protein HA466_0023520 [Hirschfeldia incana]
MLTKKKKKLRPPRALLFKPFHIARSLRKIGGMSKKSKQSISLADLGVAAIGASASSTVSSPIDNTSIFRFAFSGGSGSAIPPLPLLEASPSLPVSPPPSVAPPSMEASCLPIGSRSVMAHNGPNSPEVFVTSEKNYASLLKSSAQLQELGTPSDHVSGSPFVLIPDENIEAAKLEFKDFIYARFHGDFPSMGKIIGVVNAVWARVGPRIFVHNIGQGMYLLRVTNPKTREVLLSRTCWNIGGLPMFVAPWSPDFSPDEPPLRSAIVPVELRNVPYLLFNQQSLSRIATAIGKPESLAPETKRKENFEVAKLFVKVDLTTPLPHKIITGFTNGKEVQIEVSYPWLPIKCDSCMRFGHKTDRCVYGVGEASHKTETTRQSVADAGRSRSKSRNGRSRNKGWKKPLQQYVPVAQSKKGEAPLSSSEDNCGIRIDSADKGTQGGELATSDGGDITTTDGVAVGGDLATTDGVVFTAPQHGELTVDLEDGEICPIELEASAEPVAVSNRFASLAGFDQLSEECEVKSNATVESEEITPSQKPSDGPYMTLDKEEISSPFLPEAQDTEHEVNNHPPEDRDNPFFLVNNRKSGRKVTTQH